MLSTDPFEILVTMKDLAGSGFAKLRGEMAKTEAAAKGTNLSGFSKGAKTLEADAAAAAGGGGIGGLASGLTALAGGPIGLAVVGIGALTGVGAELNKTYEDIEVQEKALTIAAKGHGIALDDLNKFVEESITANEQYGIGASDTRGAITKLTEAGMSLADQQKAMGPIADLAKAKDLSLTDAAKVYELAIMGNQRALKEFGIALPKVTAAQADLDRAQNVVTVSSNNLTSAQDKLKLLQDQLAGKTKITAADHDRLKMAQDKVKTATDALQAAQTKLTAAQEKANSVGGRAKVVNDAITKAVGDQRNAVSPLQKAQAQLGDMWQKLATVVGPPLETLFAGVLEVVSFLVQKLVDLFSWLGRVGNAVANSPIGGFIKTVAGFVGNVAGKVGDVLGGIGNLIPHFAAGGVVEPRPGGRMILAGESGEREYVIPESRMAGLGGGSSNVHMHLYLDGQEIAYTTERILGARFALRGTSARLGSGA